MIFIKWSFDPNRCLSRDFHTNYCHDQELGSTQLNFYFIFHHQLRIDIQPFLKRKGAYENLWLSSPLSIFVQFWFNAWKSIKSHLKHWPVDICLFGGWNASSISFQIDWNWLKMIFLFGRETVKRRTKKRFFTLEIAFREVFNYAVFFQIAFSGIY
jgi:hypothetical protein